MTGWRPDVFPMPADRQAAQLLSLIRTIVSSASAGGVCPEMEEGPVGRLIAFLRTIDRGGRRRLLMATGEGATADEIALVNLVREAQGGEGAALEARAVWLVRRAHVGGAVGAAAEVAAALAGAGVVFAPMTGARGSPAQPPRSAAPAVTDGETPGRAPACRTL